MFEFPLNHCLQVIFFVVDVSSDYDGWHWHLLIVLMSTDPIFFFLVFKKTLTACIVQIFFAWRIRILTNNLYFVAFIIAAALLGGGDTCRHITIIILLHVCLFFLKKNNS